VGATADVFACLDGRPLDTIDITTMGVTPICGFMMGSRMGELNSAANEVGAGVVSRTGSSCTVRVIYTSEELMIPRRSCPVMCCPVMCGD
jgi:acetate kinase